MAVYDELDELRAVVRESDNNEGEYNVLLIGDTEMLCVVDGVELGSTDKDTKACFRIYHKLRNINVPAYTPSFRHSGWLYLNQIFVHSKSSVRHLGGFHKTTENIAERRITKALRHYEMSIKDDKLWVVDCVERNERLHTNDDNDSGGDDDNYDYKDCYYYCNGYYGDEHNDAN